MFFLLNKPKIYSYLVVFSTVLILFFTAAVLTEENQYEVRPVSSATGLLEKPIDKVDTEKRIATITIDCMENDQNVEKILDILDKHSVKITFCMYGEWVKKYPELVLKINEKGHSIANMSDSYKDISELSYEDVSKNMREGEHKLSSLLKKEIKLFKCPYGKYGENIMNAANDNAYTVIGYNIDTLDYQGIEANVIWNNIKNKITNGSIISMNSKAEFIIEELDLVINSMKEREYQIVTIESLINL